MPERGYALALQSPSGAAVEITDELIEQAIAGSRQSPRRRIILPLHSGGEDPMHRMLNAMQPESYAAPHVHRTPAKAETMLVLRGALGYALFDESGNILQCGVLRAGSARFGIDLRPGVYHMGFALEPDTVLFEAKTGPYDAATDKQFAPWAPAEGTPEAPAYLRKITEQVLHSEGRNGP